MRQDARLEIRIPCELKDILYQLSKAQSVKMSFLLRKMVENQCRQDVKLEPGLKSLWASYTKKLADTEPAKSKAGKRKGKKRKGGDLLDSKLADKSLFNFQDIIQAGKM